MQQKDLCLANTATLLACRSIAQVFSENIYELAHLRKGWNLDYAHALKKRITELYDQHFAGLKEQLHPEKLDAWRELMIAALTDLAIIRASVKVDFKGDKDFLKDFFNQMGYSQYFSDAKNGNHVSMYNFIYAFASQLTPEIAGKITARGLDSHVVARITEYALSLADFKECFEVIEDPARVDDEGRKLLEEVYQEIQDICRIATAYYYFDPLKREAFNFFKALRNI